ncbi:ABC transporter permease [Auritidibacter sp. NML100628]|uniref:ABC transporter permease n=1 Tax=Auritidibacter sp. NML100628 TaxID=2170742 RepID=UPI000D73FB0C|nr:ABC transporter permease [Auritidibacter sp. NML100628]PXA76648.1 ABC transporter permease [Auritidibacter sp. NML100628]
MWRRLSREDKILLAGIPVLVIILLGGWLVWQAAATLDDIEARTLDLSNVAVMAGEHVVLVLVCTIVVVLTAVPVGILLTRGSLRRLATPVTFIANMGQAAPVIGVIVLLAMWWGFGATTAVVSLWIYAFLPVLANTIAALRSVDPELIEVARGISMSPWQVLFRVELPMALPVIMVGVRTALVLLVGAGAFATFIDAGGLGTLITTGISLYRFPILISGALLIGTLALLIEWVGRLCEAILAPKGVTA